MLRAMIRFFAPVVPVSCPAVTTTRVPTAKPANSFVMRSARSNQVIHPAQSTPADISASSTPVASVAGPNVAMIFVCAG
jgi:hypothetical protein